MDDPALTGNAVINAAAVWFIFKAIEVIAFVVYDSYSAISKWLRDRADPDPPPRQITYEPRRGWIEYVLSGAGFLNIGLCRQRRVLLLLISTSIPLIVFILELLSITLGNESRTCQTSTDMNVISSPSLVLFGGGPRHIDVSTLIEEIRSGAPVNNFRPCILWSSNHAGVDFISRLCANTMSTFGHFRVSMLNLLSVQPTGLFLAQPGKEIRRDPVFGFDVAAFQPNQSRRHPRGEGSFMVLGSITFTSEVVVNGKQVLYRDTTNAEMSAENKTRLIQDVDTALKLTGYQVELREWRDDYGFIWADWNSFLDGLPAVTLATLSQATREPIRAAAEMSSSNLQLNSESPRAIEISCDKDFRLPRTASIIIVVIGVIGRLILIFTSASLSSVEFALEQSERHPFKNDIKVGEQP